MTSLDNGLLAPLLAALVFKLAPSRTLALILSIRNNALAPTTRDSTLNGQCGQAALLPAVVACKLDERLTAVAKTIMSRNDLAMLLLAVTVNGELFALTFNTEIKEEYEQLLTPIFQVCLVCLPSQLRRWHYLPNSIPHLHWRGRGSVYHLQPATMLLLRRLV